VEREGFSRALIVVSLCLAAGIHAAPPARYALARVLDESGKPFLAGVTPDDIFLEENGEQRTIISVSPARYPVALLLDTSGFVRDEFFRLREAASHFVLGLHDRDVAVYTFGDRSTRVVPFTRDSRAAAHALDTLFADAGSEVHVLDAFVDAADDIARRAPQVSSIVVVSGGGTDRSRRTADDLLGPLSTSRAIVRMVSRHRTTAAVESRSNLRDRPVQTALGNEVAFRGFAERTQGQFIQIASEAGYRTALDQVLEQIASEWMVEYEAVSRTAASRAIRLGIRVPGATIRGIGLSVAEK
jgi:hypothetical protein